MTGMKLGVAILGMAALAGVNQVQRSVDSFLCSDPRALYVLAQYKIATGDASTALKLVQKAKGSHATCSETKAPGQTVVQRSCPYSHRG
jgi:hypothetical protein